MIEKMRKMGFSDENITSILNHPSLVGMKPETLYKCFLESTGCLLELNYSEQDVVKMVKNHPPLCTLTKKNITTKIKDMQKLGFSFSDVYSMAKISNAIFNHNISTIKDKINDFITLSNQTYSYEEALQIIKVNPNILGYSKKNLTTHISDIMEMGYSKRAVFKMIQDFPNLLGVGIDSMRDKANAFIRLGYTEKQVIRMTKSFPNLYGYDTTRYADRFQKFTEFGYTKEQFIKMSVSQPNLYGFDFDTVTSKIDKMVELGHSKEHVIKITASAPSLLNNEAKTVASKHQTFLDLGFYPKEIDTMVYQQPTLYTLSVENIRNTILDIEKLDFERNQVLWICLNYPAIISARIDSTKEKVDYLREIQLEPAILKKPKILIQSVALTYAKYEFYKDQGIEIDMDNYNLLFNSQKDFESQYDVSKEELLEKYDYQVYKKEKTNGRVV